MAKLEEPRDDGAEWDTEGPDRVNFSDPAVRGSFSSLLWSERLGSGTLTLYHSLRWETVLSAL